MSHPTSPIDPATAVADVVGAVGNDDFPARFLSALEHLAGTDLCSAFLVDSSGSLRCLFACGAHPEIPDFAHAASLRYATQYWRRDLTTRRIIARTANPSGIHVVRQAASVIKDPEYRRACYEQGGIVERVTIYRTAPPQALASAYRTKRSGPFSLTDLDHLQTYAPILIASVAKHDELRRGAARVSLHPPAEEIAQRLLAGWRTLSIREAEVSAHLLLGHTQQEIAEASGLGVSSVVTYRQRAYRKLGISRRRDLVRLYDGLRATADGAGQPRQATASV